MLLNLRGEGERINPSMNKYSLKPFPPQKISYFKEKLEDRGKVTIEFRVWPDIRPFSISSRIPYIEIIQTNIRQFNLLYLTTKILLNIQKIT